MLSQERSVPSLAPGLYRQSKTGPRYGSIVKHDPGFRSYSDIPWSFCSSCKLDAKSLNPHFIFLHLYAFLLISCQELPCVFD